MQPVNASVPAGVGYLQNSSSSLSENFRAGVTAKDYNDGGAEILEVQAGSIAERSGLHEKDVIAEGQSRHP